MSELIKKTQLYVEAANNSDLETLTGLFADNMVFTDPSVKNLKPKAAILEFFRVTFEATQGTLKFKIVSLIEHENTTVMEFDISIGDDVYSGVDIFEWENGLITGLRGYVNGLSGS